MPRRESAPYGSLRAQGRQVETSANQTLTAGLFGGFLGAEADVFRERRRHRGDLFAFGGAGDRGAGLVEDGLDAGGWRVEVVEQFGHQHAVLAGGIVGHLARRRRGQDQRVVGRADRRQAMGVFAEAALVRVTPGGVTLTSAASANTPMAWRRSARPTTR